MCTPKPSTESLFLASIESQRFDPQLKIQTASPPPTVTKNEAPKCHIPSHPNRLIKKKSSTIVCPLLRLQGHVEIPTTVVRSEKTPLLNPDKTKTETPNSRCEDNGRIAQPTSDDQAGYHSSSDCCIPPIGDIFKRKGHIHTIDVYEKKEGETTRTVVRPFKSIANRATSPAREAFRQLDCSCGTNAFEEELDFAQVQRKKRLPADASEFIIRVETKLERSVTQAMLDERGNVSQVDMASGRVELRE
ncbi:hypothetical protein CPB84DRAFT_1743008 [Gymnopilus junonius]|uniref:Uncharacterized protein n=1 Tax=Gymnopilus junonius TaxID=109634 RepID=A0A9P5TT31_GYMJU|nr:hypothetical protein CPB84DRAFT_1743008 [Gymnopilus junonius]